MRLRITAEPARRDHSAGADAQQNDGQHRREDAIRSVDEELQEAKPDHLQRQQRRARQKRGPEQTPGAGAERRVSGGCLGERGRRAFSRRRASAAATAATARLSAPAASAVARSPSHSINQSSPPSAPARAPSVFQPYSWPSTRPKLGSRRVRALASSGSVKPMAVARNSITANATDRRRRFTIQVRASRWVKSQPSVGLRAGRPKTIATPKTPTIPRRSRRASGDAAAIPSVERQFHCRRPAPP